MKTPADLYIDGIRKKLKNHWATWLPGEKLKLGDVGILDGRLFTRVTSLPDLGIAFKERPDTDSTPMDYVSETGVAIYFKAAGEVSPDLPGISQGNAGVGVAFNSSGAFVFNAPETHEPTIENIVQLEKDIVNAYQKGRWNPEWMVIVRIVTAPVATILISNSLESRIELSAEGALPTGTTVDLGSAAIKFERKSQKGDILRFIQAKNLTPLFQLAQVRHWHNPFVEPSFAIKAMRTNTSGMAALTPELAQWPEVADSLYLGLVTDADPDERL